MTLLLIGMAVGIALGLTGAGGAIVAIPLLMLGMDLRPQDAMGISLGAVSAAAMMGVLLRRDRHPPIWGAAMGLAITGMLGAPFGRWLAHQVDERLVLLMFCALALYLSLGMWRNAGSGGAGLTVRRELAGNRIWMMPLAGLGIGTLAGFFGVGGGFLIVPFLTLYAGLQMEKAVSTSLLVIGLIGSSGYLYHVATHSGQDVASLSLLAAGSIVGILAGTIGASHIPAARLQRIFSVFVVVVMTYLLGSNFT